MSTIKSISLGDVEIFGCKHIVTWTGGEKEGCIIIDGVNTYAQFTRILEGLENQASASTPPPGYTPEEEAAWTVKPEPLVSGPGMRKKVEAAMEEAAAEEDDQEALEQEEQEAEQEVIEEEEQPDYSAVYARMTRLGDLVKFLQELGYGDYAQILDAAKQIQASGECPMLMKVDNLEKRLKTTCTALQIPMSS